MAIIRKVIYTDLPGQAKQLREKAGQLNSELHHIYQKVDGWKETWYGDRYNKLVGDLNDMVPGFNEIVDLMYRRIPSSIETIANNYSNLDRGSNITTVDNSAALRLDTLDFSFAEGQFGMSTIESEGAKTEIDRSFSSILSYIDDLRVLITNLSWESDASDAFREEFEKNRAYVTKIIESVKADFGKSIAKSISETQDVESKNTVS